MKLDDLKKETYEFSGKVSDLVRQFAFAGIAIIWVFNNVGQQSLPLIPGQHPLPLIPLGLLLSLKFLILGLAFDLFQYIYQTLYLTIFYFIKEKTLVDKTSSFTIPTFLGWSPNFFFIAKVVFVIIGYYKIWLYLLAKINI